MKYKFRQGYHAPKGLDAEEAGRELFRIREQYGFLKNDIVVNEAASKSSPIHSAFDWDDATAAQSWREKQAANLIRSVIIVEQKKPEMHAFTLVVERVDNEPVKYYLPTEEVAKDEVMLNSAMLLLRRQLAAIERSIEELEGLSGKKNRKARKAIKELQSSFGL